MSQLNALLFLLMAAIDYYYSFNQLTFFEYIVVYLLLAIFYSTQAIYEKISDD